MHPKNRPPRASSQAGQAGLSFPEVLLAALIIATSVVASTTSLGTSASVFSYFVDGSHEALMLAQEVHEAALLLPWEAAPGDPPLFGDAVYQLSDLDGRDYTPPRSAEYVVIASHLDWKQEVVVRTVDLNDPTIVVDPHTFLGPTLTELVVTVKRSNQVMGSSSWWMSEPAGQ